MHYQGTLQVPPTISAPGIKPQTIYELASSIDIGATLLELCELPFYEGIQGEPLVPILSGEKESVRDCILIEDDIATVTARLTPIPAKARTLVTKTHRYTHNSKLEKQLFNLGEDPDELIDLSRKDQLARSLKIDQMMDTLIHADDAARGAPTTI
tara:strand:- start:44 stop:508 length:465 start_codon:yes stop_codon:yes gene_type:complete